MLKMHREILEKWVALVPSILTAFGEQKMRKIEEKKTEKGNKNFGGMHKMRGVTSEYPATHLHVIE